MVPHILKKDIRLLWPLAALVAALHLCAAIPRHLQDLGNHSGQLALIADLMSLASLLGVVVVVVVAMHQDAVPGVRQDWLTRPIRRGDLILAKLCFVLLMVLGPLWLVDLGTALVDGFSIPAACVAASGRGLAVLCEFALPAMLVGVITRSFIEAFVVAAIGLVVYMLCFQVILSMLLGVKATVLTSGLSWMFDATFYTAALAGTAIVLCVQYFRRRTNLSRWLVGAGGAATIACAFIPWRLAFGVQQVLSPQPTGAQSIQLSFDPQLGRYRWPRGAAPNVTTALYVPLRAAGVPQGASVLMDYADVRIIGLDGKVLYQGRSSISIDGLGSIFDTEFEIRNDQQSDDHSPLYQRLYLPAAVIAQLGDRPVRIGIDYSLTLFKPWATSSVPAVGAHEVLKDLGHCATQIDAEGDDVRIGCLSTSPQPSCFTAYLQYPATGLRNPEIHSCIPEYSPTFFAQLWPDAIKRSSGELRFFDRSGMFHYPIDGSKLADSQLTIQTYIPVDHFTRHVDMPVVRLADLLGVASVATDPQPPTELPRKLY
jgi:hypothetical protein